MPWKSIMTWSSYISSLTTTKFCRKSGRMPSLAHDQKGFSAPAKPGDSFGSTKPTQPQLPSFVLPRPHQYIPYIWYIPYIPYIPYHNPPLNNIGGKQLNFTITSLQNLFISLFMKDRGAKYPCSLLLETCILMLCYSLPSVIWPLSPHFLLLSWTREVILELYQHYWKSGKCSQHIQWFMSLLDPLLRIVDFASLLTTSRGSSIFSSTNPR